MALTAYQKNKYNGLKRELAYYERLANQNPNNNGYINTLANYKKQIEEMEAKFPELTGKLDTKGENYIELKVDQVVVRKQGDKVIVKVDTTFTYTEYNVAQLKSNLNNAFDVIATAAKFEPSTKNVTAEI